jgi:TP901 family phage tail tape measure protein
MATFNQTVEILFSTVDETSKDIKNIDQEFEDLNKSLFDTDKAIAEVDNGFEALSKSLSSTGNEVEHTEEELQDLFKTANLVDKGLEGVEAGLDGVSGSALDAGKNIDTADNRFKKIAKSVESAGDGIQRAGQRLEEVSAPVSDITKKFLLFEAAILAVGTAFAAKAFNEAVKFESALLDLQKVLGESEGNAADFTDEVDALSLKFGESANEILQGAADIKQAGFTVEEAFLLQEQALKAAVISELDVSDATTLLIRSLKGFKAPAEDATRILDLFNEVSNKNATNVRELATGFSEFAPVAQKLGLSFEETNALLVPIIETFGSGAEAGNALKIALTSLIVPTGPAADELGRLGIAVRDSSGELRKGRDVTFELIEALSGMSGTQQIATLSIIAGERQSARLSESLANLTKVNKILEDQSSATGSAQRELNIRLKASETQINITKEAFNILARTIGERFRVELTEIIGGVGRLQIAFKELVEGGALDEFFAAIEPQLEKLNDAFIGIAKALPEAFKDVDFTPITKALEEIFEGAGSLFDDLDLSKPEDLAKVINRLIEIGGSFIQTTEGILTVFGSVGSAIISLVEFYGSLDKDTQQLIGTVGGLSVVFSALAPVITSLGLAVSALSGVGAIGGLIAAFAGPVGLAAAAITAGLALKNAREEAGEAEARLAKLPATIETAASAFKRLGFETIDSFKNALKTGEVFFDKIRDSYG